VAIPKTMDNDILWVWQSFGFLSAVEKAREILTILDTEVKSNPRLCILQLFGSDSGFVVSHTVAASGSDQCDAALIPEVKFSLRDLARYLRRQMYKRKDADPSVIVPSGFVVMAETAIPTDAICYVDSEDQIPEDLRPDWKFIRERIKLEAKFLCKMSETINLSKKEKEEIYDFHRTTRDERRIQGQTSDKLRSAGLKIVSRGLQELILLEDPSFGIQSQPDWKKLRIVTNEPRHVLRSIAPTCSDIIMGQRLGTLAVDNAMAGYTDFMISQWLTEFVLVPLPLVVLGRKRIPMKGMFWKSVLAKTGQPENLDESVGKLP
jgi:6-phosphofructokinase